jgi:hypothetical protein
MSYTLFIDDERQVFDPTWVVARNVEEAKQIVRERGLPSYMSLDHDLGGDETVMQFLHWLSQEYYESGCPEYQIHSANPVGQQNIGAFLRSWNKSLII